MSGATTRTLKPWALLAYLGLVVVAAALGLGAYWPGLRLSPLAEVYPHASNPALSLALVLVYGVVRLPYGVGPGELVAVTLLVVAANYGYELLLPLWNTRDVTDAHLGAVGAVVALVYLEVVRRRGLSPPDPCPRGCRAA